MDTLRPPSSGARRTRRRARAVALLLAVGVTAALLDGCVDQIATPPPTDFAPISVVNDTATDVRITYGIGKAGRGVQVRGAQNNSFAELSPGETESFDFDLAEGPATPRCTTLPIVAQTLLDRDVALIPPPVCAGAVLRLSEHRVSSP